MLFHLSCRAAAQGRNVVWLCSQARLEQSPPLLPRGLHRSSPALASIAFKYITDLSGLRRYGACLHLLPRPPDVLIVDDLSDLTAATRHAPHAITPLVLLEPGRGTRDGELTKALALLVDALEHARDATGRVCQLFVSDMAGEDGPRSLYLLSRWFHAVVSLTGAYWSPAHLLSRPRRTPPSALTLRVAAAGEQHVPAALAAAQVHYSVSHACIAAEALTTAVAAG